MSTRATYKTRELRDELHRCKMAEAVSLFDADIVQAMNGLCRAATSYKGVCEEYCNGARHDSMERNEPGSWQRWINRRLRSLSSTLYRHGQTLKMCVVVQQDPRGATVRLKRPTDGPEDYGLAVPGS